MSQAPFESQSSMNQSSFTRRRFLTQSVSCGAYIAGLAAFAPQSIRAAFQSNQDREIVTEEKWARIEQVADGVWAVISTPFENGDRLTLSNGGIIAGTDRVLVVEAFMNPEGAAWVAEWAEKLTKRWPTDVAVTHYHADHSGGASGYEKGDRPLRIWTTDETNRLVTESRKGRPADRPSLDHVSSLKADDVTEVDLGDRTVQISPRVGHTPSDAVIEIKEPHVVFCGDLYFNRMVPNYMDAQPKALSRHVAEMTGDDETVYVPGHGAVASNADYSDYRDFLGAMEGTVRELFEKGITAEEAAERFQMPANYEDYYIFSPQVIPRLVAAWYREFSA